MFDVLIHSYICETEIFIGNERQYIIMALILLSYSVKYLNYTRNRSRTGKILEVQTILVEKKKKKKLLQKFLSQGLNLHHSSDLSLSSNKVESLTHCTTREF